MNIKITPTEEDVLAFQLFIASNSERIRKNIKKSRFGLSIFFLIIGILPFILGFAHELGYAYLLFAILWFFFHPFYTKWRYERHYKKYIIEHQLAVPFEVQLWEEGVESENEFGKSTIKFNAIKSISETKKYFFVLLSKGTGLTFPKEQVNETEFRNKLKEIAEKANITLEQKLNWDNQLIMKQP